MLLTFIVSFELKAESPVTFSGYLRIRSYTTGGYFPPLAEAGQTQSEVKAGDHLFLTRLRISIVFKPNDNVEVRWRFHAPHGYRWGANSANDLVARTIYAFGILKTSFGNFSVGRISSDVNSAGLQTLGYSPTWGMGSQGYIFDSDSEHDAMLYRNDWDNGMGLKIFYAKLNSFTPSTSASPRDADRDLFSVEPYYKWETGGVSLALQYERNNYLNNQNLTLHPRKNYFFTVNPAFVQNWSVGEDTSLALHAEAKYSGGKYQDSDPQDRNKPGPSHHQDGFGAYLDLALDYSSGTSTLAGWYFDGNSERQTAPNSTDFRTGSERHSLVGPGEGFYPFVVFYLNHTAPAARLDNKLFGGKESPNHWALALMGNHKITDNVTLNYGVADFRRTRGYRLSDGRSVSKHLGTEFDLGIVVKFLENVQFSSKVGVFSSGNYYKERYLNDVFDGTVWAWGNELIFNF
ncbi:MAG: hypothetical protein LBR53_10575 [Deltaproteobacteria bacterium]|nr:hypothetical protein [Deltaproteobacteria bacterium]